jgi:hypothetical protein
MSTDYFFLYVLLASNATLLAIAAVAVIRFERRWQRLESFWDSPTGAALSDDSEDELHEQLRATARLEQRLGELQRTVKLLDMKAPEERPPVERDLPIENAVRMARLGASVEDLTRNCGLNVGEARLMKKLHGKAAVAANSLH